MITDNPYTGTFIQCQLYMGYKEGYPSSGHLNCINPHTI